MKPPFRANQIIDFFYILHPLGVFCAREKQEPKAAGTKARCWLLVCVACVWSLDADAQVNDTRGKEIK